jgi:uncharacterized protein
MKVSISVPKLLLLSVLLAGPVLIHAQYGQDIFKKIKNAMTAYKLDTSSPPADKTSSLIAELRSLGGGFNINEAIEFKMEEELQEKKISEKDLAPVRESFRNGTARKWLDNAVTWIYRRHFSYKELKHIVRFYKTGPGQKLAAEFPYVMIESLAAAEMIHKQFERK